MNSIKSIGKYFSCFVCSFSPHTSSCLDTVHRGGHMTQVTLPGKIHQQQLLEVEFGEIKFFFFFQSFLQIHEIRSEISKKYLYPSVILEED